MPYANVVRFLEAQDRWLNNFPKEIVYVPGIVECVDSSAKKDLPRKFCKDEIKRCVQQTEYGIHVNADTDAEGIERRELLFR